MNSDDIAVPIFFMSMLILGGIWVNISAHFNKEWRFDVTHLCAQGHIKEHLSWVRRQHTYGIKRELSDLIDAPELTQWLYENNIQHTFSFAGYDSIYGGYEKIYLVFKKEKYAVFFKMCWNIDPQL